jgi:SAM-dependent methyltransferase
MSSNCSSPYFGIFQQLLETGAAEETPPYQAEEARLYDVLQAHSADLVFYKEFCLEHPGPIFEIGVGTGRVLLELAELGLPLTGIEKEADMIKRLQEKPLPKNLTILLGDVMTAPLPKEQKAILLSLNLLHHFIGREEKIALLKRLRESVAEGGFLIVDSDKPQSFSTTSGETFVMVAETIDSEEPILYVTQSFFDEVSGVDYNNSLKIPLGRNLGQKPTVTSWEWHPESDIQKLLQDAGWKIVESYGSYEKEPLSESSTAQIYVCSSCKSQEIQ